ncbi:MAG TPA: hypothetical protein VFK16_04445 [Gemmatimonadaceae bacterium]|nr:hypothetical protein [Gemmatimonadaceae bacterium]
MIAIFVGAVATAAIRRHFSGPPDVPAASQSYSEDAAPSPYVEEEAILFGSPTCGASTINGLAARTASLIDSLRAAAQAKGDSFTTVGVSIDGPVADGLSWLEPFGTFDEVVIGHNWLNSAVADHIWSDPGATPALPQLILVRRHVAQGQQAIRIGPDTVVHRWVGTGDLAPAIVAALRHQ